MKMFIAGNWAENGNTIEVANPFDGSVIDTVPRASRDDVDRAVAGAVEGAAIMRRTPGYDRFKILRRVAALMEERNDELGRLISQEEGKTLREGRTEVSRATETIELSAEEAKRLGGEMLPLDGAPGGAPRMGFTIRIPCGA
jgi:acyl-CoA reductase-like NAD-dependent aldehyde dehydrogenase